MSLDITTQANLHLEKLADLAIGQLYFQLGFMRETTMWNTNSVIENGGTWSVPIVGNLTSNTRAPGAGVTDQTPTPTKNSVTITEREVSYIVDPTHEDSEAGQRFAAQQLQNAVNALAIDITTAFLDTIATTAGLTAFGTLGVAVNKAVYDGARAELTNDSIPVDPRWAIVSPETMTDTVNIAEFSRMDANGIPGVFSQGMVRQAAGFTIIESPHVRSPLAGQHQGFAGNPKGIYSVFPRQGLFNDGGNTKIEAEIDGMRIAILREYVTGQNGAYRMTVSSRHGFRVGDPTRGDIVVINGQ